MNAYQPQVLCGEALKSKQASRGGMTVGARRAVPLCEDGAFGESPFSTRVSIDFSYECGKVFHPNLSFQRTKGISGLEHVEIFLGLCPDSDC